MDNKNFKLTNKTKKNLFTYIMILGLISIPVSIELFIKIFYNTTYWGTLATLKTKALENPENRKLLDEQIRKKGTMGIEEDRYLFWRLTPNIKLSWRSNIGMINRKVFKYSFSTNSFGFRSPPISEKKPKNCFRIMCLGDSATFATGVPQDSTYPGFLEQYLDTHYPASDFDVVNTGVPGYSSFQGRILFEKKILRFDPDIVTLCFGANDMAKVAKSDEAVYRFRESFLGGIAFYFMKSGLVRLLRFQMIQSSRKINSSDLDNSLVPRVSAKQLKENYSVIINEARRRNIDIILMERNLLWPLNSSLPSPVEKNIAGKMGVGFVWSSKVLKRAVHNLNTKEGMKEIRDYYNSLHGEKLKKYPYLYVLLNPGHPNAFGNQIIARALYDEVQKSAKFRNIIHQSK